MLSKNKNKNLVLDLDETLIHATLNKHYFKYDFSFELENGKQIYIKKRPYLDEFLKALTKMKYEVILFTASKESFARDVIKRIDPDDIYFQHMLFNKHCTIINGYNKKDLRILGKDLSQTIIVDNSEHCFDLQPKNGMRCITWYKNPKDSELEYILRWLMKMENEDTVYETIAQFSGTSRSESNKFVKFLPKIDNKN